MGVTTLLPMGLVLLQIPPPRGPRPPFPPLRPPRPPRTVAITAGARSVVGKVVPLAGVQGGPLPWVPGDADLSRWYRGVVDVVRLGQDSGPNMHTLAAIFPNIHASPTDPRAYDFSVIDPWIEAALRAGARPMWEAMYDIGGGDYWTPRGRFQAGRAPSDLKKWSSTIVHVLMHWNDGWAGGHRWGVDLVEFINEPIGLGGLRTPERLLEVYGAFAKAIADYNRRFGHNVKVVGPAVPSSLHRTSEALFRKFLRFVRKKRLPLDIFSYHSYPGPGAQPLDEYKLAVFIRKLLDSEGFRSTPIMASEWGGGRPPRWLARDPLLASAYRASYATVVRILWQGVVDYSIQYRANRSPRNLRADGTQYFRYDGAPRPAYFALVTLSEMARETPLRLRTKCPQMPGFAAMAARSRSGDKVYLLLANYLEGTLIYTFKVTGLRPNATFRLEKFVVDRNTNASQSVTYRWTPIATSLVRADSHGTIVVKDKLPNLTVHYMRLES